MCGRYASFREAQDLADHFAVADGAIADDAIALPPSWNVAPTDPVRVVVERERDHDRRWLRVARWGLVPGWAKDPSVGARMINARAETLADKPAFRKALAARRCLVPAEGYYEWRPPAPGSARGTPKQPVWVHDPDGQPLALAGLYEFWRDPRAADDDPHRWLVTTTIVTTDARDGDPDLADVHDRRPVVLAADDWDAWLDPHRTDPTEAVAMLHGPEPRLVPTRVSTAVNKVGTNGPELLDPPDDA